MIRPYQKGDYQKLKSWLAELSHWYDGHEEGRFVDQLVDKTGEDNLGYFTTAKEIYFLVNDQKQGAIVLNYKRGGSVKIGPFVVDSKARGLGVGTRLVKFAERRAKKTGRRKLYATTSHLNKPANHIFEKCGFQIEAKFPSQYRQGSKELIWGKVLLKKKGSLKSVSTFLGGQSKRLEITPYLPKFHPELKSLMLKKLSGWHDEIGEEFVNQTVSGHQRGLDFEEKGKVILLALNDRKVRGCSVLVPKRGGPAKVYPILGQEDAQRKLMAESKVAAKAIGCHKVYTFAPTEDKKQQALFESLGFARRGVLIEPYKPGQDLVCYDYFL